MSAAESLEDRAAVVIDSAFGSAPVFAEWPRHAARQLAEAGLLAPAGERRVIDLTAREAQILGEVGRFGTHAEAARSLGLARNTVEQHLVSVRRKLDVTSTSEALAVARRRGVVS